MLLKSLTQSILMYQPRQNSGVINSDEVQITSTVLNCMCEATSRDFGLIIICLPIDMFLLRQIILDLCLCLKNHPQTKNIPIAVSVDRWHRAITIKLANAGVNFMDKRAPNAPIDPEYLFHQVQFGNPSIRINRILDKLCPWIHYQSIDDRCELTTCKAYKNRMVLGGRRLHEVCETDDHIYCDYFLCPRLNS